MNNCDNCIHTKVCSKCMKYTVNNAEQCPLFEKERSYDTCLLINPSPCGTCSAFLEARPHGEWIPCSERLPEERGYYLVTTDGSHNDVIDIAEYGIAIRKGPNGAIYTTCEWNKASKIIAWQPLPTPYEKEGDP